MHFVASQATISSMKIKHKGLRLLVEDDNPGRVPADLLPRLRLVLSALAVATRPSDLPAVPGLRLHPLKGDQRGLWSLSVSRNWRIVFRFEGMEAVDVDLVDYH